MIHSFQAVPPLAGCKLDLFIHQGDHDSDALPSSGGTGPSNVIVFPWRITVTAALGVSERVTRRRRLGEHYSIYREMLKQP